MNHASLDSQGLIVTCPQCGQNNRLRYERLTQQPKCAKCSQPLALPAVPLDVTTEAEFTALTGRAALPVLVDFWAAWCGPCKMIAPELARVAAQGAGRWIVAKVNTELLPPVARRCAVSSIPLLVLFQGGRELARQPGAMPAPAILQFLQRHAQVRP